MPPSSALSRAIASACLGPSVRSSVLEPESPGNGKQGTPIGLGRVMRVHAAQSQDVFVEKVERAAEASSIPHHVREQQIEWHSLRHEIEHVVVASVESPSHRQAKCFPPRAGTLHPWYSDADAWLLRQRCSDGEFIICARTDAAGVPDPWRKLHI